MRRRWLSVRAIRKGNIARSSGRTKRLLGRFDGHMTDLAAIKSRLSNPREVAAMLGLRVFTNRPGGVITACPVHGNKSGSLLMRVGPDGTLQVNCKSCSFGPKGQGGDIFTLLEAIEGDFKRGLARAIEMAGGVPNGTYTKPAYQEPERCDPDVYHELATRILDAGKLDGRPWTLPVQDYLGRRGLLELARADGWAALPSLRWLQTMAPNEVLIKAKLARWTDRGEFVASWPGHRLVIPWRGPDARICALQRRHVIDADGPKYVLPWAPEWPYGSERLGYGLSASVNESRANKMGALGGEISQNGASRVIPSSSILPQHVQVLRSNVRSCGRIAIVEGAVDTLAMRALYPSFLAIGIPGIGGWRASWASLVEGRGIRIALDRGKPGNDGIIPEDRAAARIALDCAGRGQETDRVLEWWLGRWRRGRALGCVLCGAGEAWLCGGCGRRRAPVGSDWGGLWEARRR
jgi:hypothetical protein